MMNAMTDNLHQFDVTGHHVVLYMFRINLPVDFRKKFSSAFDLCLFHWAEFHAGHGPFCFGNEVDVFDRAILEGYGPVRVIIAYRRGDQEPPGKLRVDDHVATGVQLLDKFTLNIGIRYHVIVNMVLQLLAGLAEILFGLARRENVDIVGFRNTVVA